MSSPEEPDDARDIPLSKTDRRRLQDLIARIFNSDDSARQLLAEMVFPREQVPIFRAPESFWETVFHDLDNGAIPTPYRRLRAATRPRSYKYRGIDDIFDPYEDDDPLAGKVPDLPADTCHVIVWARTERQRRAVAGWLDGLGFNPWEVWSNSEMTSYGLNQTDESIVGRWMSQRPQLLFKLVPPGQPDYLLDRVTVVGGARRAFPMREVPVQLTVSDLAASAARLHPAGSSAAGQVRSAMRIGADGHTHRVQPARTLWEEGFRDGDRINIGSVRFGTIKVLFIGASPRQHDKTSPEERGELRFSDEARSIGGTVRLGHLDLVRVYPHAQARDFREIADYHPDIIHLSCHGADGTLLLEDEEGGADPITAARLADRLYKRAIHNSLDLSGIVLNACGGESIAAAFSEVARTVVAHQNALPEPSALLFTRLLYEELARTPALGAAALLVASSIKDEDRQVEGLDGNLLIIPPLTTGGL